MGNFFIAGKEKALIDASHLTSLGLYALDEDSLNTERIDGEICAAMVAPFPVRTQNLVRRICRI